MTDIDLTPFGFTPTENRVYGALLEMGPSSGYGLAKGLSIARANAYQALNGLVAKGAAVATGDQPQRYRAERPDAVLARVVNSEARKLELLEDQVSAIGPRSGATTIPIEGRRGLVDLALKTVAREKGEVVCLGPPDLLAELSPGWRRRSADRRPSSLWLVGDDPGNLPTAPVGSVDLARLAEFFDSPVFFLVAGDVAIFARLEPRRSSGYWTSDLTILGAIRAATAALTA
jgi:sugar-specific transcriptional regulator TrmB